MQAQFETACIIMSWIDAKSAASAWLRGLNLPNDLHGRVIDLSQLSASLTARDQFRTMVLRAAARELRHQGAKIKKA